jgi:hypothetical protein
MQTRFKAEIEEAINGVFNRHIENMEDDPWDFPIHPNLVHEMATAAEVVVDTAQSAKEYYQREMQ